MTRQPWLTCSRSILAGFLLLVLTGTPVSATVIDLNFVAAATGTDNGPQDGVFDAFVLSLGAVNNNGFTSLRTALEFDISAVPAGSVINGATLTMLVGFVEGTRQVALHGYVGDGTISLGDLSLNGIVGNAALSPPGSQTLLFDSTAFINSLVAGGEPFAGFNIREDPANLSNFGVLYFLDAAPRLSVDFVARAVPEPSVIWLLGVALFTLLCVQRLCAWRKSPTNNSVG
jgi:hypothetical protein